MNDLQKPPQNSFKLTLSIFSGEDKNYVRQAKRPARIVLAWIGAFVILIFLGCLFSAYFFFDSLFNGNLAASIPVGIFWGLLVANLYLLLLYTVSPAILPNKNKQPGSSSGMFTFSMLLRLGFMSLLAIITAQPLNVELFSDSVDASLKRHISEERAKMIISSDRYIIGEEVKELKGFVQKMTLNGEVTQNTNPQIVRINQKVAQDSVFIKKSDGILKKLDKLEARFYLSAKQKEQQNELLSELEILIEEEIQSDKQIYSVLLAAEFENDDAKEFQAIVSSAIASKLKNYEDLDSLLSKSNFYIKRVQLILYECPLSFLSTTLVCFLFLFPIVLKYHVRKLSNYYSGRIKMEMDDVVRRYEQFKLDYSKTLRENIDSFKFSSQNRISAELRKLKSVNFERFRQLEKEIEQEYQSEIFAKYEHWMDNPFRTMRRPKPKRIMQSHLDLMDLVHAKPEIDSQ